MFSESISFLLRLDLLVCIIYLLVFVMHFESAACTVLRARVVVFMIVKLFSRKTGTCTKVLYIYEFHGENILKGTVSRDFFALVFFLNLFILVLLEMP